MKKLRVGFMLMVFLIAGCSLGNEAATRAKFEWAPPNNGVIRDKAAAISIAHDIWFSMNPSLKKSSDDVWQNEMQATLVDGIWYVRQKPPSSNSIGGGLEISLSAKDARVVRIILTQ